MSLKSIRWFVVTAILIWVLVELTPMRRYALLPDNATIKTFTVKPVEGFEMQEARVLSAMHYTEDWAHELCPVDLALGWGPMSDPEIIERIDVIQERRFFYWRSANMPIPKSDIVCHCANMHMIPEEPEIEEKLLALKEGDVIRFKGYLVDVKCELTDRKWVSSRTRHDTGEGACEIVYITDLEVIESGS